MYKSRKVAQLGIFSALIILLQVIATFINNGSFPITLTLVPIIVGACVYGKNFGGLLGLVFGGIVFLMVITGSDPNGLIMFQSRPFATFLVVFLKGFLCGYVSGLVYELIAKKAQRLATILAAITCPIVNTLVFYIFLILFFDGSLKLLVGAFLGFNFILELVINVLLAPGLSDLIKRNKERLFKE